MSEKAGRYEVKKLGPTSSRIIRTWGSAVYRSSILDPVSYIFINGRGSRPGTYYITNKEFAHSITITFISFGILGIGLGQIFAEFIKG